MPFSRPDFSEYVGHFCKTAAPFVSDGIPADSPTVTASSAFDRLISILTMQRIIATPMPWTNRDAVAFTECPWGSLVGPHACPTPASRFRPLQSPASFPTAQPTGILPGMSTRPRSEAGPPMTLGNMRANGVRSLAVSCWQCQAFPIILSHLSSLSAKIGSA
jgi:hypothetical protein